MSLKNFAVAAVALSSIASAAASPFDEVRFGATLQDTGPFTTNKESGVGVIGEVLFDSPSFLSAVGKPRPMIGGSFATAERATSFGYAGLAWTLPIGERFFLEGAVSLAVHDGEVSFDPADPLINETTYLGCRVLARLSADVGYRINDRLSVLAHVSHMSNADVCSENEGLDNSGLRLGYTF